MVTASQIKAGAAYVELVVRDKKLRAGLARAQASLAAFAAGVKNVGRQMIKLAAIAAVPFVLSARTFARFEQQMANVSTMLDDVEKDLGPFTQAIKIMAVEFGESTDALAGGLYDILSASIPTEKAISVLTVAVKAAKAGMTDTKTAADAITTVMNAYGLAADDAADASDFLFTIVKKGKTTFGELAPNIGKAASIAAKAGISLDDFGALMGVMTKNGVQTEEALTALNGVIQAFIKPTSDAERAAAKLGLKLESATLSTEGLLGVFEKLEGLSADEIAKIFPNIRALKGVLPALGDMEGFIDGLEAQASRAGATGVAYEKMTSTIVHSFNQAKQAVALAALEIGESLGVSLRSVAIQIGDIASRVAAWVSKNRELVVIAAKIVVAVGAIGGALVVVGTVLGGIISVVGGLVTAISVAIIALVTIGPYLVALATPATAVVIAIAALATGLTLAGLAALAAAGYFLYATGILGDLWKIIKTALGPAIRWLGKTFEVLLDDATFAFGGIKAALAAGDIQEAAEILWRFLVLEFQRGKLAVIEAWLELKRRILANPINRVIIGQIIEGFLKVKAVIEGQIELWHRLATVANFSIKSIQKNWDRLMATVVPGGMLIERVLQNWADVMEPLIPKDEESEGDQRLRDRAEQDVEDAEEANADAVFRKKNKAGRERRLQDADDERAKRVSMAPGRDPIGEQAKQAEKAAKEQADNAAIDADWVEQMADRLHALQVSHIDDEHKRRMASIKERFRLEKREAERAGKDITKLRGLEIKELDFERGRNRKEIAREDTRRQAERAEEKEAEDFDRERLGIMLAEEGVSEDLALNELERRRALKEQAALIGAAQGRIGEAIDAGDVSREIALKRELIAAQARVGGINEEFDKRAQLAKQREGVSTTDIRGAFSARAIQGMGGANTSEMILKKAAERNRLIESTNRALEEIERHSRANRRLLVEGF